MPRTLVSGFEEVDGALLVHVRPTWRLPRCSECRKVCRGGVVLSKGRRWRHLDLWGVTTFLVCDVRRCYCPRCGALRREAVPWAEDPRARFTEAFDLLVALLAQRMDKAAVERSLAISWRSVGRCVERVMTRFGLDDPLKGLKRIGIDEISFRKGHDYITLVTDLDRGRIVWGTEGKGAKPIEAFFDELGEERAWAVEVVCTDMANGVRQAVERRAPRATLVVDRYHVQALVNKALDRVRQDELGAFSTKATQGSRWALLKNPESLTSAQQEKLAEVQRHNQRLYRAYLLKEQFRAILDRRQPNVVRVLLEKWCSWAQRCRLKPFASVVKTVKRELDRLIAYIRTRASNGIVEGLNGKVRLLIRRAYGFHSAGAVIAMARLCCTKIALPPVRRPLSL